MRSPQPLRFKYNTLATTVSQNADDFEAIKIEQDQGPNRWQAIELMPEEVDQIMEQIAAGKKEGVVTHVGDITNKTKYSVTDKGITLIGWATDNKGANPVGESMAVMLKRKDFDQIQGWMVRYDEGVAESVEVKDPIETAFEAEVLSILGYNK